MPIPAFMAPRNEQVAAMFAEEKPFLLPLPLEPFRYYQHGKRGVNLDGCVEVDAAYYGLPPGWIGREVKVAGGFDLCHDVLLKNCLGGNLQSDHCPFVCFKETLLFRREH